jgi:2,3-bisphosphoglycerate-independent phosphoglycerate mutase
VLVENGAPVGKINDGDAVVFCCRRGEREIELAELFTDQHFDLVEHRKLKDLHFVIMTMYHEKFKDLPIAFAPSIIRLQLHSSGYRSPAPAITAAALAKAAHQASFCVTA